MTRALLATKHGKLELIAPALAEVGWELGAVEVDTDRLGTFDGHRPRRHPPLETARRKALLAGRLGDAPWLLASEGSFSAMGWGLTRDVELVVAVERSTGVVVAGRAASLEVHAFALDLAVGAPLADLPDRLAGADLPRHRLVLAERGGRRRPIGGLESADEVVEALGRLSGGRRPRPLRLSTDLRAHLCPSRQPVIAEAAGDLARRLSTRCPRCEAGGWGPEESIQGLPCEACRRPTLEALGQRWRCPRCAHEAVEPGAQSVAPAERCAACNP